MQIRYYKEYSRFLNRFMEFKVYGHAGRPIVIFPCQSGRFFDWEDRNMCNAAASWIDSGKLQIFTVDSIDPESWDNNGPERPRIEMQERWYNYVCEEFVPRLLEINREQGEDRLAAYAEMFFELRKDKGVTAEDALKQMHNYNYFGTMMIKAGDADGMVSGANHSTADTVRPALQIIKSAKKGRAVSSAVLEVVNGKPYILSDCAIVINPTAAELADIAVDAAQTALQFGIEPNVALLSYSTKGSGKGEGVDKVAEAARLAGEQLKLPEYKDLPIKIDGEMQADAALDAVVAAKKAPGSEVAGQANVLIFPDIEAGNISYKLLQRLGGAEAYGPILQGLNAPVNDLSRGALVEDIVGMIAITALQAAKK